jgi:poly(A) polymerase
MDNKKDLAGLIDAVNERSSRNELYVVGGFIRDCLLKRPTGDIDFAVSGDAELFTRNMSRSLKGTFVPLDKENGIYRIVIARGNSHFNLDFSKLRGNGIENDLSLRDFTVNALAVRSSDIARGTVRFRAENIIDPFGGIKDIRRKTIRKVSDRIFADDPLRLLRAYRMKAELGFSIETGTVKLIGRCHRRVKLPAAERIKDELMKILACDGSSAVIAELDRQKILGQLIPEIEKMKKSARRFYYHREGLWQHAKESLAALEHILGNLREYAGEHTLRLEEYLKGRKALLKLSTLLHDVGKPRTARVIGGRTRFFGHENTGETMIGRILERLRMSGSQVQQGKKLVKNHMRPSNLGKVENLTERAVYRYFRDMEDESIELLLLSLADISSYLPPFAARRRGKAKHSDLSKQKKFVKFMIGRYFRYIEKSSEKKLVDGNVVMKKFSLDSGPLIGAILKLIREQQALGKIRLREDALKYIEKRLPKLKKTYKQK